MPRPIIEGDLYLVTRRAAGRCFFLRPSPLVNQIIEYIVAVVAARTGVLIHALTVLSNHYHLAASDPEGRMPAFLRDANSLIARHLNCTFGCWESLWANEQTSLVRASGDEDVKGRMVYTMANPTAAGLVAHGKSWPGLRMMWPEQRKPVARPVGFFREDGPMPDFATLELARPPGFDDMDDDELAVHFANVVEKAEARVRADMAAAGRRFLGRRAVLRQSRHDRPRSRAPRRQLSPRVAAKNKWRRIEALARLGDFIARYREALPLWRQGVRDTLFPRGTYKLRIEAGVRCACF